MASHTTAAWTATTQPFYFPIILHVVASLQGSQKFSAQMLCSKHSGLDIGEQSHHCTRQDSNFAAPGPKHSLGAGHFCGTEVPYPMTLQPQSHTAYLHAW